MYLIIHVSTERLKRLLRSWANPGPKHRKLREGQVVAKLGPGAFLMRFDREILRLLGYQKGRYPNDVTIYTAEELDQNRIWEIYSTMQTKP